MLSPSTRRFDLLLKRDRFQQAGIPSHWLVDPDVPSVTVLELRDGSYEQVAHGSGQEVVAVAAPYAMTFTAAGLLD